MTTIGDPARLHQVLANLLANATDPHPGRHHGLVRPADRTRSRRSITVTDNGPGIPAALQPEIFNRFVRGDSSRSRAAGSTGLGPGHRRRGRRRARRHGVGGEPAGEHHLHRSGCPPAVRRPTSRGLRRSVRGRRSVADGDLCWAVVHGGPPSG